MYCKPDSSENKTATVLISKRWFSSWEQTAVVRFTSQHAQGGSQLSVVPVSGKSDELFLAPQTHGSHTYTQMTHTYKM